MRFIVMGTGPIGGIIGGRLARAGHDVTFVDVDREHVAAIREHGLHVDVPDGAFNVKATVSSRTRSREPSIRPSSPSAATTPRIRWPRRCRI